MTERFVLRNVKRVNGEEIDIVIENGKIAQMAIAGEGAGGNMGWSRCLCIKRMDRHACPCFS